MATDTHTHTHTTVVGAIIVSSYEEVLLLQRAPHESYPGLWELPSGKVEEGEPVHCALRRELQEEAGLTLTSVERECQSFSYEVDGQKRTQRNFLVRVEDLSQLRLSEEHSSWTLAPLWRTRWWRQDKMSDEVFHVLEELWDKHSLALVSVC